MTDIAARLASELRAVRHRLRGQQADLHDGVDDEVAVSVAGELRELDARTRELNVHREQLLVAAQGRLLAGTYGQCVSCDEPIPKARLLVVPEAARCAGCQNRLDRERGAAGPARLRAVVVDDTDDDPLPPPVDLDTLDAEPDELAVAPTPRKRGRPRNQR